jgi:hypothetical protein
VADYSLPSYATSLLEEDEDGKLPLQPANDDKLGEGGQEASLLPVSEPSDQETSSKYTLPDYANSPEPDSAPVEAAVIARATESDNKDHAALAKKMAPKLDMPYDTVRHLDPKELKNQELAKKLGNLHPSAKPVVDAMAAEPYANIQFTDSIAQMEVVMRGIRREAKAEQDAKADAEFRGQSTWERQFKNPVVSGTSIMMGGINLKSANTAKDLLNRMGQLDAAEGNFTEQIRVIFGVPEGLNIDSGKYRQLGYSPDQLLSRYHRDKSSRQQLREMVSRGIKTDVVDLGDWERLQKSLPRDPGFENAIQSGDPMQLLGYVMDNPSAVWRLMLQTAPNMAATLGARALGGPVTGGAASLALEQGAAMVQLLQEEGVDLTNPAAVLEMLQDRELMKEIETRAFKKGVGVAVLDVFGMLLAPFRVMGKGGAVEVVKGLGKAAPVSVATRAGKEVVQGVGQRWAGYSVNAITQAFIQAGTEGAGELFGQYLSGMDINLAEGLAEAIAGGGMSFGDVGAAAASKVVWKVRDSNAQKVYAENAAEFLKTGDEAVLNVKNVPAAQRDMPLVAETMAAAMEEDGVEAVWIDAEALDGLNQDSNFDLIDTLSLDKDVVAEAVESGGSVEISAAAFARHILGVDGFAALIEHAKKDESGMTPAQSKEFEETARAEIDAEIARTESELLGRVGLTEAEAVSLNEDFELIQSDVYSQLRATGQSEQVAGLNSLLDAQRAVTRSLAASRASGTYISPLTLYDRDNRRIVGTPNPTAPLNQIDPLADPENVAWRDATVTTVNPEGVSELVTAGEAFDSFQQRKDTARRLLDCIRAG